MTQILWKPQPGPQTALVACPVFEVFYGGARGGGKTEGSIGDWLQHSEEYGQNANGAFFRREERQLEEVVARTETLFTPLGAVYNRQKSTWTMKNGARLKFRYLARDADAEAYQGHSYTRVYVEEVTNFPSFTPIKKLFATLRSAAGVPCGIRLTGNPGGPGHGWVKARYIDPAPKGYQVIQDIIEVDGFAPMTRDRIFIPSRLTDNQELMRNDPGYLANLATSGTKALVKAWLLGDWDTPVGAYFVEFSRSLHVLPARFEKLIPYNALRFGSFDWGYAKPFSFGQWAVSDGSWGLPRGALLRYREWYGSNGTPNEGLRLDAGLVARGCLNRIGPDKLQYVAADPSVFKKDGGPSIAEAFAVEGLFLRRADNNRVSGWDKVRQHLNGQLGEDRPKDGLVPPLLYILDCCPDSIRTLESVPSDPDHPEDVDTDAEDHAADDVRYGVMSRPWIIDSLPPRVIKLGRTLNDLFARRERSHDLSLIR